MKDSILIVDDNPDVISSLRRILIDEPYDVYTANSGIEGISILKTHPKIKVVISDEKMPGMLGAEFLSKVKTMYPEIIRIILTGYADMEAVIKAVNNGEIYRFFTKPWNEYDLKFAINAALHKYNMEEKNRMLLKTVKQQATELKRLEEQFPGITKLKMDKTGNLILPELSAEEYNEMIKKYNMEFN